MKLTKKQLREMVKEAVVGLGTKGTGLTWQADFPKTTNCCKCGDTARLLYVFKETEGTKKLIASLYKNKSFPNKKEGLWLHDAGAFATYLCKDINCATATTLWNQA